jgi:MFS family permease
MLGTGLCSTATSMAYLIAARAVAGMGGGGLLTCTSIILTDLLPLRKRGLFQGLTQIIFSIGSALGGPVGGFLTEALGWRAAFGVQVPLLGLSTLAIVIFLRLPPHPSSSGPTSTAGFSSRAMTLLGRMDLLGSLFLVTSLLSLLFGLSLLSASRLPFSHPAVYSCLLAFPLLAAAFVYVESIVKEPVLPLRLLRQRTTVCASLFYLLSSAAITGLFFVSAPPRLHSASRSSPSSTCRSTSRRCCCSPRAKPVRRAASPPQ